MDDNKTKIIRFLLGQMPLEEKEEFEKTLSAKSKEKDLLKKYKQIIDQIDQNYARKIISEELAESHFIDQEEVSIENTTYCIL